MVARAVEAEDKCSGFAHGADRVSRGLMRFLFFDIHGTSACDDEIRMAQDEGQGGRTKPFKGTKR